MFDHFIISIEQVVIKFHEGVEGKKRDVAKYARALFQAGKPKEPSLP